MPTSRMNATTTYADDRAGQPRGDVERAAGAHRVVRDRGDDLARRELAADRRGLRGRRGARRPARAGTRPAASSRRRIGVASRPRPPASRRGRAGRASRRRAPGCRARRSRPGSRGRSRTASAPAPASRRRRRARPRPACGPGAVRPRPAAARASACRDSWIGDRKPDHGVLLRTDGEEFCSMRRRGTRPRPLIVATASSGLEGGGRGRNAI